MVIVEMVITGCEFVVYSLCHRPGMYVCMISGCEYEHSL